MSFGGRDADVSGLVCVLKSSSREEDINPRNN